MEPGNGGQQSLPRECFIEEAAFKMHCKGWVEDRKGLGRCGCLKTENCRSMKVLSHRKGGPGPAHVQGGADWDVRSGSEQFVRGIEQPVEEVTAACGEPLVARVVPT